MQTTEHSNEQLVGIADGCSVLAGQFDKSSPVAITLNSATDAIRELLFYRRLADQPGGGPKLYITSPTDAPGIIRPGEPLPRPFVVAIMPYAKWLILESSAQRVEEAEATAADMSKSAQRNADLADNFEKELVAERAKNAPPATT